MQEICTFSVIIPNGTCDGTRSFQFVINVISMVCRPLVLFSHTPKRVFVFCTIRLMCVCVYA